MLDDFSWCAFDPEFRAFPVGRSSWKEELERQTPDMLLVESAWSGNGAEWQYVLTQGEHPKEPIVELVEWCRRRGIPTVFWNKEDPFSYETFVGAARLFDHVFTVDDETVSRYEQDLSHDRIGVLPFAAQPRVHTPIEAEGCRTRPVAFAGAWYGDKFPERLDQMRALLGPARDFGLDIYSRFSGNAKHQFPPPLSESVVGELSYDRMLAAYKLYRVFLNVNSVIGSTTMCARRIFELLASRTPVVSGPSAAILPQLGPGLVSECASEEETREALTILLENHELRDRIATRGLRKVLRDHTYSTRVDHLLSGVLGRSYRRGQPLVSVVCSTMKLADLDNLVTNVAAQHYPSLELVVVLHGLSERDARVSERAAAAGVEAVRVIEAPGTDTLGQCLNRGVDHSAGEVIAKFDDDNLYGPDYLSDAVDAFSYTDAGVVGKWTHYVFLEGSDCLLLRHPGREHRYQDLVQGGSIAARADVFERCRFPAQTVGEDTTFLGSCREAGIKIYSLDRFNYVSIRRSDPAEHTWQVADSHLLRSGRAVVFGRNLDHAMA